jgi:hypothetical protein
VTVHGRHGLLARESVVNTAVVRRCGDREIGGRDREVNTLLSLPGD